MANKTLKEFLDKKDFSLRDEDGYEFAKNLTLEEFLEQCTRGDWILWLFQKSNPDSIKELTLAKGHCANTVRHLMEDEMSRKAVDVAIAFGEGRANLKELEEAADAAGDARAADGVIAARAACAACATCAVAGWAVTWPAAGGAGDEESQKQTADICRKYLPIEIWNIK